MLVVSMCLILLFAYVWLFGVLFDYRVKANIIICEVFDKCAMRSSTIGGAYDMNIIEWVSKSLNFENFLNVRDQL